MLKGNGRWNITMAQVVSKSRLLSNRTMGSLMMLNYSKHNWIECLHLAWRWGVTYSPILEHTDKELSQLVTFLLLVRLHQSNKKIIPIFMSDSPDYSTVLVSPQFSIFYCQSWKERQRTEKRLTLSQLRGPNTTIHNAAISSAALCYLSVSTSSTSKTVWSKSTRSTSLIHGRQKLRVQIPGAESEHHCATHWLNTQLYKMMRCSMRAVHTTI